MDLKIMEHGFIKQSELRAALFPPSFRESNYKTRFGTGASSARATIFFFVFKIGVPPDKIHHFALHIQNVQKSPSQMQPKAVT